MDNATYPSTAGSLPTTSTTIGIIQELCQHPYRYALLFFVGLCFLTRTITGLQSTAKPSPKFPQAKTIEVLPYWIPWLGHAIPFAVGFQEWLAREHAKRQAGCFSIVLGGTKHNIVAVPSVAKQILDSREFPVENKEIIYHVMDAFYKDQGTIRALGDDVVFGELHAVVKEMTKESFVAPAIDVTVKLVEDRMPNLISGCAAYIDQSRWEREGNVSLVGQKGSTFVAEANLRDLMFNFVTEIATEALMGKNFMQNYPDVPADVWTHDSKFMLLMLKMPDWLPWMRKAAAARERSTQAVIEHHAALKEYVNGRDPGPQWSDMSDVSRVMVLRAQAFDKHNAPSRSLGVSDYGLIWAMNVNANPMICWLLWHLHAHQDILEEVRAEVKPFVRFREIPDTGLPIKEAPKLDIDMNGLLNKCPLLKGAFFEAMRIESLPTSYKSINEDFIVTESVEDARTFGRSQPQTWVFPKGELICIPHSVHQGDERYWKDPETFNVRRFWKYKDGRDVDLKKGEHYDPQDIKMDYGTMKVWGGGATLCKGRAFAEREVLVFVAAFITTWEMTTVDHGGKWVHPGRVGGSSNTPKAAMNVRLSRRD